ncbi:phage tail family protein [Nonomuraea sediminis]|uniref:phage tail family protein n=1 Tax=Nonomuraea sediminis TaxID=2835864 RepID=UPI001BDC1708|nr:phage tail family protein [Nonomuraea sediminis]
MAIAIDAGSPAIATSGGTTVSSVTTGSFTRPAGGLLVAMVMAYSDTEPAVSGGGLTWTKRVELGQVEIWTAPVTGSGSMTVTVDNLTGSFGRAVSVKVDAVTGQHASSPIGASGSGSSTNNTLNVTGYTSTVDNSRGFMAALEGAGLGVPTSSDTGFGWSTSTGVTTVSGIAVRKSANTPTAGTAVTFNADAPGTSAADWDWVALEIKPASLDAPITTTTVAEVTAVPTPTVQVSASPTPATVTESTAVPAPSVSAGSTAHPTTVPVTTGVPDPSVTTQTTTVVTPGTVTETTSMPAPQLVATSHAALSSIDAIVQMYAPTLTADAHAGLTTISVLADVIAPSVTVPVLPGDAIFQPGQIEWNGFLLGNGTPYSWQELQGWIDSAPFVSGNVDRPDSSGSYPGQPYYAERVINWSTLMQARPEMVGQIVHDLVMATGPHQTEDEGWLVVWDFGDTQPWLVRAFLGDRKPGSIDRTAVHLGFLRGGLQWIASDPRRYNPVRSSLTIAKNSPTEILNNGNDATPGEIRIAGPCTGPQIDNVTLDLVIAFSTPLATGQTLVIDVKEGTASIGDTDHVNDLIEGSTSIRDFVFGPGANQLEFTCASGGTAGMDVFWRHAVS